MRPIKSACWIGLLVLALGLAGGRPTGAAPAAGQATPRLALLGSTTFANQHPANGVAVQGRYAYVAYGDAAYEGYGLRIVDLQNPASPAIVGGVNLRPPGQTGQVNAVAVAGAYAYLAAGYEGLKIIDVANPAAPRVVATYLPPPYQFVWDVAVSGTRAYLGLGDSILIVDVAAANRPRLLGQLVAQVKTIHVSGTTLYGGRYSTLAVIDVANPAAPALRGTVTTPGGEMNDIASDGATVYVGHSGCGSGCGGVTVVNAADPAAPAIIHTHAVESAVTALDNAGPLLVVSTHTYCLAGTPPCGGALLSLDMAAPQTPQLLARTNLGAGANSVDLAGGLVAVTYNTPYFYFGDGVVALYDPASRLPFSAFVPLALGQ